MLLTAVKLMLYRRVAHYRVWSAEGPEPYMMPP